MQVPTPSQSPRRGDGHGPPPTLSTRLSSQRLRIILVLTAVAALVATFFVGMPRTTTASAAPSTYSMWGSATPDVAADSDTRSVEIGVRFSTEDPGWITELRYYKSAQNTGPHTGTLWSPSGQVLATASFERETPSGWQQAPLGKPVKVTTGVAYTASYHAPVGRYAGDVGTLSAEQPKRTRALTATQGVYTYKSGMPKSVWRDSNYYVDVVFTTVPPDSISGATGTTAPKPSTTTALPRPTTTAPRPTTIASPTQAAPSVKGWPDASTTGVAQCPALEKVRTGGQVMLTSDGQTYENKEFLEPTVINVRAQNVTIRCVKFNGTGWYGIDNTDRPSSVTVDRVEINCQDKGQVVGMLLRDATVSRANVHNCDHMINAGGDNLTIRDSYCHALTDKPVVHADCIQSMGGNTNLRIEHNSLWSRDTSDILLGDEYGLAKNVVIHDNRLMSEGDPPPAYLLYLGGTNTVVTDNRFTRRYTYGHCTDIAKPGAQTVWSGNVWDDDGSPVRSC